MKQRPGVVLLLALLCILALEISAAGLHYATVQELRTARSAGRDAAMRLSARSAIARTFAVWPADLIDGIPVHSSIMVPDAAVSADHGVTATALIERVAPNLFLIRATAVSPLGESMRIGALAATADPATIALSFKSAVRADGPVTLRAGSRVTDRGNICPAAPSSALRIALDATLSNSGSISGPVLRDTSNAGIDRIGSLDRQHIAAAASRLDTSFAPLRFAAHDSVFEPIDGAGVLVIAGNADIRGGTFQGIIIVLGSATLSRDAHISGSLIVAGGSLDLVSATVSFDACAIHDALLNPRLLGPYRPRGRMWIPLF